MKIPSNLKIGGHEYEVSVRNRKTSDGAENLGTCDNIVTKIWLESECTETLQAETLLHEIIEAISYIYSVGLSHPQIVLCSATLYQVLKDNNLYFGEEENKQKEVDVNDK